MLAPESLDIIIRTVKKLRQEDPDYDQHPAVVIAPGWWVEKIKAAGGGEPDAELESVEGCAVIVKEVAEPAILAADGRMWSAIPAWLRQRPVTAIEGVGDGQDH